MRRFFSGLFLLFVFSLSALSADKASQDAMAMLRAAAEKAVGYQDARFAFTLDHWSVENGKEISLKLRFDPRWPAGEQWRLIDKEADDLDKPARKVLKGYQKGETNDSMLVYDKLDELIADAVLREETETYAEFSANLNDDEMSEDMRNAIEAVIRLEKLEGYVSRIDVRSTREFKPAAVAKIKSMTQSQVYSAPVEDGPALMRQGEGFVDGKAMFKKFRAESKTVISDIEAVDSADISVSGAG